MSTVAAIDSQADNTMMRIHTLVALVLALAAGASTAGSVAVESYSMVNGNGRAAGGSKNYWDLCYGGVCDKSIDSQSLAGGTGDLTDGIVTAYNWATVESVAGTGPYVGWHRASAPNVAIDFNFHGVVDIDAVSVHADDANGAGSVALPEKVLISWSGGSRMFDVLDPASAAPQWLTFAGLGITGVSTIHVQLFHKGWWLFVDEVRFDGRQGALLEPNAGSVPEPSSALLVGLALLGACLRGRPAPQRIAASRQCIR